MKTPKIFLHGVPDSPAVWGPLKAALSLPAEDVSTPALPGFTSPPPNDFTATKDAYTDWLITILEQMYATSGPIDIVGHDWGALLTIRAASLRPELIKSWAVSGAVIHPDYRGHTTAKRWATPLLGELVMAITSKGLLKKTLIDGGLPATVASLEAANWNKTQRKCILQLYRSAAGLRFEGDWVEDLQNLPANGLVLWGEKDPFVAPQFGRSFAEQQSVPFHVIPETGHWAIAQQPTKIAEHLRALWANQAI